MFKGQSLPVSGVSYYSMRVCLLVFGRQLFALNKGTGQGQEHRQGQGRRKGKSKGKGMGKGRSIGKGKSMGKGKGKGRGK